MFNVDRIVSAMIASHNASWVPALVEERVANPKAKADDIDAKIAAGMSARVDAGEIDVDSARVMLSYARTMIHCPVNVLVEACEDGHGINGVAKRIRAVVGKRSNAGRKAGQGAGKTTKPAEDTAQAEKPAVPNHDASWKQFLEALRAQVPARKDWNSEDITAFQECAARIIALISRNAK
jgi:hypothetical protein